MMAYICNYMHLLAKSLIRFVKLSNGKSKFMHPTIGFCRLNRTKSMLDIGVDIGIVSSYFKRNIFRFELIYFFDIDGI